MSDQKKTILKKRSGTGERKSLSLGKGLGSLLSDAPKKEDSTVKAVSARERYMQRLIG